MWESLRPGLRDENKVSLFDTISFTYLWLQQALIAQNKTETALEISERGRARAFVELLALRLGGLSEEESKPPPAPTINQIQQIAKAQNATLVEYSLVSDQELYIWVIPPTGEITFRQVDLNSLNTSLLEFIDRTRISINTRSNPQPQQLVFAPGDLVRLKDDAPDYEPWQIVAFDQANQILTLTHPSFGSPEVTFQRPVSDVYASCKTNSCQAEYQELQQLHQLLIDPIADLLPTDPQAHVIFMPHGELFLVPFVALQDGQGKFLIEKHTILTAPAIQVLDLTHQQKGNREVGENILVVGNPTMPTIPITNPPQTLSSLPGAEQEAKAIASLLETQPLLGNQATKANVLEKMENAAIIHLATHGLLGDIRQLGVPGAIALAPSAGDNGFLTAGEILQLKLKADLVVLSACNTGQGKITGDGVIGLSRSLVTAGVPSVIVSLWQVPDAPTAELMTEFYQNLEQDPNKAQALRQAMLTMMAEHPHPKDWAAFTLIGESD